jgi:hypothetical protein
MNKSRHYLIVVASIIHYRHSMSRPLVKKKKKDTTPPYVQIKGGYFIISK